MKRRVCVVTGTRAEYGLLRGVMEGIRAHDRLALQLVATGMHLEPVFGSTYREITADGFHIDAKVDMQLTSDTPAGLARSMGLGLCGFGEVFARLKPDLLLVLGDRFEILSAVTGATVARIPIAHLHGGETTEGAFDEGIRHAITKLSHLHFVAAEEYRRRVVQLGENPDRVFLVGGLGVDAIQRLKLLGREAVEMHLGISLGKKSLLVTFHPVTLENDTASHQMAELLASLESRTDTTLIFTLPNADTGGRALIKMIEAFVKDRPNARAYASLGQLVYLSCVRAVDAVVGNSSSGLTEAPSLGTGTINIGDRQRGRLKADSVIDCAPNRASITRAIDQLYSADWMAQQKASRNPYGEGGASEKIVGVIADCQLEAILKKTFYNLPC